MPTLHEVTYLRDGEVLKALIWEESPDHAREYVEKRLRGRVMIVKGEGAEDGEIDADAQPTSEPYKPPQPITCPDCAYRLHTPAWVVKSDAEFIWYGWRCERCRQEWDGVWQREPGVLEKIVRSDRVRPTTCPRCRGWLQVGTRTIHEGDNGGWYAARCGECGIELSVMLQQGGGMLSEDEEGPN